MPDLVPDGLVVVALPAPAPVVRAAPPLPAPATVLPVPGPAGPRGRAADELTADQLDHLADVAAAQLADELEPPVDLTLLFENAIV